MRRLLVLIALLGAMFGLRLFEADSGAAESALVLAAIGFVLLASFTVAEMGTLLTLPRVTGYIVTGTLLAMFGILSPAVVLEMKMFNTLALGLIAISAGLELSVSQLGKVLKTLTWTILIKIVLGVPLVFAAFYLFERYLGPLGLGTTSHIIGLGLVLGALSIGTSPSIALAVISETKSRGRLTDIVLGAAVLKDLVVVVALAFAVAVTRGLVAPGEGGGHGLSHVFLEIGYSLGAGALLGILLILYIRYVKAEMLLFVAAMILVVAEVSNLLHLELLLVFIAGGFVVRNFSEYEHQLLDPVQMVSLPVFVVFFTIAGASIDLSTTFRILPLAATLCAVRAFAFYVSARIGNSIGKESDAVRENAWLAYLPQAGVTLGLVGLASSQLPTLAETIHSTGLAVVALNLLVGPVALRAALKRAGEIPEVSVDAPGQPAQGEEAETEDEEESPIDRLPEPLRPSFVWLERQLIHQFQETLKSDWMRWSHETSEKCLALSHSLAKSEKESQAAFSALRPGPALLAASADEHRELFLAARKTVRGLPEVLEVPLEEGNRRVVKGDGLSVRFSKRAQMFGRALTFVRRPVRRVPVRELARLHFEPRLAELAAHAWASRMRVLAGVFEDLTLTAQGGLEQAEFEARVARRFDAWERTVRKQARSVSRRAVAAMRSDALLVDSAYLARGKVRASGAERGVREALSVLEDAEAWTRVFDSAWQGIALYEQIKRLRRELETSLSQGVIAPGQQALDALLGVFVSWAEGLEALAAPLRLDAESAEQEVQDREALLSLAIRGFDELDARLHDEGASTFEGAMAAFRSSVDLRPLVHQTTEAVTSLPEALVLSRPVNPASEAVSPGALEYRRVEPRKTAERCLLADAMNEAEKFVSDVEESPRKALRAVFLILEATRLEVRALSHELHGPTARKNLGDALFSRAGEIRAHVAELRDEEEGYFSALRSTVARSLSELSSQLEEGGLSLGELVRGRGLGQMLETFTLVRERTARRSARIVQQIRRAIREAVRSEISLEVQAKFQGGDFDAAAIRGFLERHTPQAAKGEYGAYFLRTPLRETSQFVAHREVLREIMAAEREWIAGGPSSVLLVGAPGSGRTSLLNLLQHASFGKSLVRPHPARWRRDVGLLQALAYELGCRARPQAIERALVGKQALIIIDDLEEWIAPGLSGMETVETFLELVARTHGEAFWAVSTKTTWFELTSALTDVGGSFGRVKHLSPVSAKELAELIERRHQLSGRELVYPTTLLGKLLSRGEATRDRELFFALLSRASGGNISRALGLWLHMAQVDEAGRVEPRFSRALLVGLPFMRDLTPEQTAILVLLSRHGALSDAEITEEICAALPLVRRQLAFLLAAGLIRYEAEEAHYLVTKMWGPFIEDGLRGAKAL